MVNVDELNAAAPIVSTVLHSSAFGRAPSSTSQLRLRQEVAMSFGGGVVHRPHHVDIEQRSQAEQTETDRYMSTKHVFLAQRAGPCSMH